MTAEDEVKARNLGGSGDGTVLVLRGVESSTIDRVVGTRVEKSDQYVRLGLLLDDWHPVLRTFDHILELEVRPQLLGEPGCNIRSNHAQNSHLDAIDIEDVVGLEHRFAGTLVDGIGAEPRHVELTRQTVVIDLLARLYIVIAQADGIIANVVVGKGNEVRREGIDEVVVIHRRLSLQTVARVEEQYGAGMLLALLLDVGRDIGHGSTGRTVVADVEGEIGSVNIGRIEHDKVGLLGPLFA